MFSTDFIFRQQENLVDNQKSQAGFRPLRNKILLPICNKMNMNCTIQLEVSLYVLSICRNFLQVGQVTILFLIDCWARYYNNSNNKSRLASACGTMTESAQFTPPPHYQWSFTSVWSQFTKNWKVSQQSTIEWKLIKYFM